MKLNFQLFIFLLGYMTIYSFYNIQAINDSSDYVKIVDSSIIELIKNGNSYNIKVNNSYKSTIKTPINFLFSFDENVYF
jgi:hypothetical protein